MEEQDEHSNYRPGSSRNTDPTGSILLPFCREQPLKQLQRAHLRKTQLTSGSSVHSLDSGGAFEPWVCLQ